MKKTIVQTGTKPQNSFVRMNCTKQNFLEMTCKCSWSLSILFYAITYDFGKRFVEFQSLLGYGKNCPSFVAWHKSAMQIFTTSPASRLEIKTHGPADSLVHKCGKDWNNPSNIFSIKSYCNYNHDITRPILTFT